MPKQTFDNLPAAKRNRILELCYEEFSRREYRRASLSRIVERAGIAKGSMYQYFADKRELYLYLVDLAAADKLAYLERSRDPDPGDVFELFRSLVMQGGRYNLENPLRGSLLHNAIREDRGGELAGVALALRQQSAAFIRGVLARAAEGGQVRRDLDLELAALFVNELTLALEDILGERCGFSYGELLAAGDSRLPVGEGELRQLVDTLIEMLRCGLESRKGEPS